MALDNLPTASWAVVYGEVPSASKWSELGENDDSLATGVGMDDEAILARHLAAGLDTPVIASDTITKYAVDMQNMGAGTYHTVFDLSGAYELKAASMAGINAGFRLTIDGTAVINDTSNAQGETNTQTEEFGIAAIPAARSTTSLKLEIYNASGGSRQFGCRAYVKAL